MEYSHYALILAILEANVLGCLQAVGIYHSSLNLRRRIVLSIFYQIYFLVVFSFSLVIYMCTYLFVSIWLFIQE